MKIKKTKYDDFIQRDNNAFIRKINIDIELDKRNFLGKKYILEAEISLYFKYQNGGFIDSYIPLNWENKIKSSELNTVWKFIERQMKEEIDAMNQQLIYESEKMKIPEIEILSVKNNLNSFGYYEVMYMLKDKKERKMVVYINDENQVEYGTLTMDNNVQDVTKRYDWEKFVFEKAINHRDFRIRKLIHGI